jgi:hypothetical protein
LALDQQEDSEEDDFGVLDPTTSDKTAPRSTKQIEEDDEDDEEGMPPFDDEGVDLDAELELVSLWKLIRLLPHVTLDSKSTQMT